jgi:hypothetical protein
MDIVSGYIESLCSCCNNTKIPFYLPADKEQKAPLCEFCMRKCVKYGITNIRAIHHLLFDKLCDRKYKTRHFIDVSRAISAGGLCLFQAGLIPDIVEHIIKMILDSPAISREFDRTARWGKYEYASKRRSSLPAYVHSGDTTFYYSLDYTTIEHANSMAYKTDFMSKKVNLEPFAKKGYFYGELYNKRPKKEYALVELCENMPQLFTFKDGVLQEYKLDTFEKYIRW